MRVDVELAALCSSGYVGDVDIVCVCVSARRGREGTMAVLLKLEVKMFVLAPNK